MSLFPKHTAPRLHHWTQEEIREIPTDRIIEKLEMCGIRFSKDEYVAAVKTVHAADDIHEQWRKRFAITAEGMDEDFVWMACEILWERLAGGKLSTEQLDDMMQEGYSRIENRDDAGGCELWLKVWEELKPRFTPETRSVGDAEEVFQGLQCLSNWCQDLEQELGNAAVDDPSFHDRRIRYCREFCRLLPDSEGNTVFNMRRAIGESLFLSGRKEEGEKEFQNLVTDYPKNPWGYIGWGDMYAGHYGEAVDAARAEELYTKALGLDPDEDEFVEERLADLRAGR